MTDRCDNKAPREGARGAARSRWPFRRVWAVALVAFRQGLRMRLWILAPLAIVVLVLADYSSPRFDPVFEAVPAAIGTALFVMLVLAVLVAVFFATYSIPAEIETKVAYTTVTKPLGCIELVGGKTLGMSALLLAMLAAVSVGACACFSFRASTVRSLAAERSREAHARYEADLNALKAVAERGPLGTHRYRNADAGPIIDIHHPAAASADADARWVLGETGMRLHWDLAEAPLSDWIGLYGASDAAARKTLLARETLREGLAAHQRSDEPQRAAKTFDVGLERLGKAADAWEATARLWQTHVQRLNRDRAPAAVRAFYANTAEAMMGTARVLAELRAGLSRADPAEAIPQIALPQVPPWRCRLDLKLEARPAPEEATRPTPVFLELIPQSPAPSRGRPASRTAQRTQYALEVQVSGSEGLSLPLVLPTGGLQEGDLPVPPTGVARLDVAAMRKGHLAGARAGALSLVGPAGEKVHVPESPVVVPKRLFGKLHLQGRSHLPRQAAVFRFGDVPEEILGGADTPVEIGFSLDAWSPATVETTAQIVFVKPGGGDSHVVRFTPESHHSTILYLDRDFWHGGPLEARLECLTSDDAFGLLPKSVRLRLPGGPFVWNFAKAVLKVWLFGTVVAAAGVLLSTRFSWFVSALATIALFLLGMIRNFLIQSIHQAARQTPVGSPTRQSQEFLGHILRLVPDLRAMLPPESVNMGEVLPFSELGATFIWAGLGVLGMVLVGALLFKKREVAA